MDSGVRIMSDMATHNQGLGPVNQTVQPIKLGHHLTVTTPPFEEWLSDEVEFSLHTDPTWSYVVGYCHVDVGLMSYAAFDTLSDLYDWLEAQGAELVS